MFLICAGLSLLGAATVAIWPGPTFHCQGAGGCTWQSQPARMLDDDEAALVGASPAAGRTFDAYALRPLVRLGIFGVTMIETAPFAILLLGVGLALRRLGGRGGEPLGAALPWLRRASLAAIVWAFARPVSDSLMAALLSPGSVSGPHLYIKVDLVDVGVALMLAVAAWATIWAIEAGVTARRDLAEIV